jgi:hypothetical protein
MFNKNSFRFIFFFAIVLGSFLCAGNAKADQNFIPCFFLRYAAFSAEDVTNAAKCDFVIASRGEFGNEIKAINPNSKIYLYQFATAVYTTQDTENVEGVNTLARWETSRGLSGFLPNGLYGSYPSWFVYYNTSTSTDPSNIVTDSYGAKYLQFGLPDYQAYFLAGTLADTVGQPWQADGDFLDGPYVGSSWSLFNNTQYASSTIRIPAMENFVENICSGLHSNGQLCAANLGGGASTVDPNGGIAAWESIDANANHPDVGLEEGTFSDGWFGNYITFQPETNWLYRINLLSQLHTMKVAYYSDTSNVISPTNLNGVDNYGKPVNFYDVLWFDLTSFLIGKNTTDNTSYFGFGDGSINSGGGWYPEYNINLGSAVGNYQMTSSSGTDIYYREFQKGYVYVNPTNTDSSSITLPQTGKQLTHDNISSDPSTLPDVTTFTLAAHRGTIILKDSAISDTTPPAAPTGLSVN